MIRNARPVLIGLVLLVTIPRVASWFAQFEQPLLWWVGIAAATAIDLLTLFFIYSFIHALRRRFSIVEVKAYAALMVWFMIGSGILQAVYLAQLTSWPVALLMASFWPLGLGGLAMGEAFDVVRAENRAEKQENQAGRVTIRQTHTITYERKPESVRLMLSQGKNQDEIMRVLNISPATYYRWLKQGENQAVSVRDDEGE